MIVWQIAGGPWRRSYAEDFLKYGVGLIGPGDAGPWKEGRGDREFGGSSVRRFATRPKVGETVVLRSGNSIVKAIGLIASDMYEYLPQFDDVNGWDLQHARRIRWCRLPQDYDFEQPVFGAKPRRFGKVHHARVVDLAQRFIKSPPTDWQSAPLPRLPPDDAAMTEAPTEKLRDLAAFANDYCNHGFGCRVSEDEMITHLIVPFFRSMGWLPEQIAVKWRHVDVAIFGQLPRRPENCRFVVEAKCPGVGAEGAIGQAKRYARKLGTQCDLVVSDGFRYRLYATQQDFQPVAYANLLRLKNSAAELFTRLKRQ
jgi:hypothetical protein